MQAAARKKVKLAASDSATPHLLEELARLRLEVQTLKAELTTKFSKADTFCMDLVDSQFESYPEALTDAPANQEQSASRSPEIAHRCDSASQSSQAADLASLASSREKIVGQANRFEASEVGRDQDRTLNIVSSSGTASTGELVMEKTAAATTKQATARELPSMTKADLVAAVHKVKQGPHGKDGQYAWKSYVCSCGYPLV